MNIKNFILKTTLFFLLIVCLLIGNIFFLSNNQSDTFVYHVKKGKFANVIYRELYDDELIISSRAFSLFCFLTGTTKQLKAGYYIFPKHASIYTINHYMVKGIHPEGKITIVEGMTENDVNEQIKHAPYLEKTYLTREDCGYLYPDTYHYEYGQNASVIINKAKKKMNDVIEDVWSKRDRDIPIKTSKAMIVVASIIIREAPDISEFDNVASVIYNRLAIRMHLGLCSTLVYVLNKSTLTKEDLNFESDYNTYRHYGLPPGPISFVSKASLEAATKYNKAFDYLYFLSADNKMYYAKTYKEHQRNINAYLK